jgi:hypothetical protein
MVEAEVMVIVENLEKFQFGISASVNVKKILSTFALFLIMN